MKVKPLKSLIGFSENNQTQLLDTLLKQFSEKDILSSGTFLKNDKEIFPFFRNRIMFPINNTKGNIIGFGGRALGDQLPKYLNSKDSPFLENLVSFMVLIKQNHARVLIILLLKATWM